MKKIFYCVSVLFVLFVSAEGAFGYLGKSIRIMGFGDELAGVIQDEYTDIYRNPAYLSFVERVKVFGQYNLYQHSELKIAEDFRNEEAGLAGIVLCLPKYGNLALIGELKPSTTKDGSTKASRSDYINYYTLDSSSVKRFSKETIQNFKVIYGFKLSPSLRLGVDFVYLKNYDDGDSNKTIVTHQKRYSEDLMHYSKDDNMDNYSNSPDAQRGTFGLVFTPGQRTSLDFALYYEKLEYTKRTSSNRVSENISVGIDTTLRKNFFWDTSRAPIKNRALGLDINFKYHFPQKTILAVLLGGRYQKNELSSLSQNKDSTYSSLNFVNTGNAKTSLEHNDRILNFSIGIGAEKDFSSSIKIGVALKGYWDREELDRFEWQKSSGISTQNDSVVGSTSYFAENRVKKTTNSYKLTFPIGTEVVLHKMIKARLGGELSVKRTETETGYSTSSQGSYSQGFGLSYDERIFLDVYLEDALTPIGNWMAKIEYRF
ncbi:MAG: hypothetical protein MUO91_04165 [candidate division Zixibacteria bacterium]|nr:hypothetical protein [candidate division Zixibacteria bacterium]